MPSSQFLTDASSLVDEYRGIGWHYRFKAIGDTPNVSLGFDSVSAQKPTVDPTKMYARAVISTATVDRVSDMLMPSGCVLDDYAKSPVVLWNHALDEGCTLPIASSANPDNGVLDVQIREDVVEAGSYFSQSLPLAVQVFGLIDEGIIRSTSVRETPLVSRQVMKGGRAITVVDRWSLEEWSWTYVGVNPDAVRKAIERNRVDGRQLHPSIMKSLKAVCPKPAKTGRGIDMSKLKSEDFDNENDVNDSMKSDTAEEKEKTPADEDVGSNGDTDTSDSTSSGTGDDVGGDDVAGGGEANDETNADYDGPMPLGKTLIDRTHAGLKGLCKSLDEGLSPQLEHEGVKRDLGEVNNQLKSLMKSCHGIHASHYSKFKSDMSDDYGDDSDDSGGDMGDSEMKSFLAQFRTAQFEVQGIPHKLKSICKSVTPKIQKQIMEVVTHVEGLLKRVESHRKSLSKPAPKQEKQQQSTLKSAGKPEDDPAVLKALNDRLDELAKRMTPR